MANTACRRMHKNQYLPRSGLVTTLIVLVAMFGPLRGIAGPARIFFGDTAHPVVAGEAWLIANRWGAYPGVLVATIRNGQLEVRQSVQFPQYWEQAYDYKLLLAVADRPVGPPASLVEDFAYTAGGEPEYLKRFSTIYLSPQSPRRSSAGTGRQPLSKSVTWLEVILSWQHYSTHNPTALPRRQTSGRRDGACFFVWVE